MSCRGDVWALLCGRCTQVLGAPIDVLGDCELNETSQMDVTERWADGGRAVQSGCGWTWSDGLFQPGQFYGSIATISSEIH